MATVMRARAGAISLSAALILATAPLVAATVERRTTLADPAQSYEVFLPDGYPGDRRWPVLIVLDPRGRSDWILEQARPGAAAHGWVVLASHQSRSDDREQITLDALQALLRESATRYAHDPKRIYIAGMSGTAKTIWVADKSLRGLVAGYIGAGGGRPPELGKFAGKPPAWFGFAGNHDFNFQEMQLLDAELAAAGGRHRLEIFDGPHGWPREAGAFSQAIDWLELVAMQEGRAPRRDAWIDARLARERAWAQRAATPFERWRRAEQIARDYAGLRDVEPERASAAKLFADPAMQAALAKERRLREEEARFARELDQWATRMHQKMVEGRRQAPPELARTLAQLRIRSLQARARDPDPAEADSAARRLERAWTAAAHYVADARRKQGDLEGERASLKFARAIFPDRDYARCMLAALDVRATGKPDPADLRACLGSSASAAQ